jgi:hypothetical protein
MVTPPTLTPVTTPAELTTAIVVLLLLHTPNAVASINVVVLPTQTFGEPTIDATEDEELMESGFVL